MRNYYIAIGALCAFGAGLVAAVLITSGTPASQRGLQLDRERINDFSSIQSAMSRYYLTHNELPPTLTELKSTSSYIDITDPETGSRYSYRMKSDTTYDLCTTFSTDSKDDPITGSSSSRYDSTSTSQHKKGYDCLTYSIPAGYNRTVQPTPKSSRPSSSEVLTN